MPVHSRPSGAPQPRTVERRQSLPPDGRPLGSSRRSRPPAARRQPKERRDRRPTSPLVHVVRLLIMGVGVGAIAGTVLSVWHPATHPALVTQQVNAATLASRSDQAGAAALLAKGQELTGLTPKIAPLTQGLQGLTPGVFLVDLDTGDQFTLNGTSSFAAASMIKVPILLALLQEVDKGRIRLDENLVMQPADVAAGSGEMQDSPPGTEYTLLQVITNMIITSDNTATNMVIRRMGGIEVLNQQFRQWGLQQTALRQVLPDLEGTNTTSPKELSMLLVMLSQGDLLSMKSRDRALDIMRRTVTDTLLPTSLREGATISHKTGDIGSLVGDTGIIDMPNGKRYAITAMVQRPFNDDRAQELIRQMSATVYDYLDQASGQRDAAPVSPAVEAVAPEGSTLPSSGTPAAEPATP